jgi:hypothetical protein
MKLGVVVHVCNLDTKEVGEGRTPVKAHPGLQILSQKNQNQNQEKKQKKKEKREDVQTHSTIHFVQRT